MNSHVNKLTHKYFISYFLSIKKNLIDKKINNDDHKIIKSDGVAAASIKSFEARLNALVEKVSKLNGLNIKVIYRN